jgi:hypothetical protein
MSRNRFKNIVLCATVGIGLLLALVALLFVVEQRRTQAEEGAVLSAFFSQVVLHDMNKWDAGRTITIVVMRNPGCRICTAPPIPLESESWFAQSLKSRGGSVLEAWFAQSSKMTRASFFLNSIFSRNLNPDLRLPIGARAVFVDASDLVWPKAGEFEARFPDNFGHFVVSHVGLNLHKTEALLYVDHFCGLCGGGGYVLMRKASGVWHIVDQYGTWVS